MENEITVQTIGKMLNNAGLKKASTQRVNFETVNVGNYTASHLKKFGQNFILVQPKNGTTLETIQSILSNVKTEIRNGYVVIL